MIYNLSPLLTLLDQSVPDANTWRDRFITFFNNEEYDPDLLDWYYNKLTNNIKEVESLLKSGHIVDTYTGLFSFSSPYIEASHSFNIAQFLSVNHPYFFKKRILTVCHDFGILNIQMKLCGLDLVSSVQKEFFNTGTVLACIGNNCPPYPINLFDFPEEDVIFMSCVFQDDILAYENWQYMLDKKSEGKEVFFTSNTYYFLRNYMNYDMIELIIDPKTVYKPEDYSDISYGYMNKIYRLK